MPRWELDSHGAEPVEAETLRNARRFLEAFPPGYPLPSVGAEPDGQITLEWYRATNWLLTVSVSREGMLYYAALLGEEDPRHLPFRGGSPGDDSLLDSPSFLAVMDPSHVPPVADDELLARFITQAKQFRPGDQTVKPDLFIPFRLTQLSVTRHREATVEELRAVGAR